MKNLFLKAALVMCACSVFNLTSAAPLNYETYLESWDPQYQQAYQGFNAATGRTYEGMTLNISFAAFLFNNSTVQGTQFANPNQEIGAIIQYVHAQGGKVKLAFGGASYALPAYPNYFISQTTANGGWPNNIQYLANGVISAITQNYGTAQNPLYLDGVDFDIEDTQPSTINGQPYSAQDFSNDLYQFLVAVRAGLPNKLISLTIPGQGWNTYWELIAKQATTLPNSPIDSVNFMEYDIYVSQGFTYAQQIAGDLLTYTSAPNEALSPNWTPGWAIPPSKIQVGLMPANDDIANNLTVKNAQDLAALASSNQYGLQGQKQPLYGVMTWDLNRDALTDLNPNNPPNNPTTLAPPAYNYSDKILQVLTDKQQRRYAKIKPNYKKSRLAPFPSQFVRQAVPPHGYLAS